LINIRFRATKTGPLIRAEKHQEWNSQMVFYRKITLIFIELFCLLALIWCAVSADDYGTAETLNRKLAAMTGKRDAVMVVAPNGSTLVAIHPDRALIPASILKLVTTLTAVKKLGLNYRFRTDFYVDPQNDLKIKGYGDPLLISEQLQVIAGHLADRLHTVRNLILDDSYFEQPVRIPGRGTSAEPYDAPNGALCVNFNTVAFNRRNGAWISDEPQTPLLPSVIPQIVASRLTRGRITLAANSTEALQYSGELFRYFFLHAGITFHGTISRGRVDPQNDRLVWSYRSQYNLRKTVADLLEYSNNFIANQILLVMGAEIMGPPANMDKGLQVLKNYCHKMLKIDDCRIVEASGISRRNRVTARSMEKVLQHYKPYHTLMRHEGRQFYKTGHLNGIRSRAGFLKSAHGGMYRFVVIINTPGKTPNRIMNAIEHYLK
jgi:serine-type D-Ala-D-Ala carboxypeptidase/endopeptidase (penicillin-binding protein 4)